MKTRIISAAVAIVLLAAVLYFHSTIIFSVALSLIGSLMVFEVIKAVGLGKEYFILIPSVLLVFFVPIISRIYDGYILYPALGFAYVCIMMLAMFKSHEKLNIESIYLSTAETILISASMLSLAFIEKLAVYGLALEFLILTFCGAWFADTGAYFAGTFFGKHKLCPTISPKKTIEGLIGGFLANALVFALFGYLFLSPSGMVPNYLLLVFMGVVCAGLGLIGDLSASLIKRKYGIKDYGNIMPGHGGAMDRFDSVVFVAPFMAICLTQLTVIA